jgi:uncharacterized protein YndB with AHSA1/START domain
MRVDRVPRRVEASIGRVYGALTTQSAVGCWLPPEGAQGIVEVFEPWPGGAFRMTLVFENSGESGSRKSSPLTDVVHGEFVQLVPDELVRQCFTFKTEDPSFAGRMTMTWALTSGEGATYVTVSAENVPVGITPHDHQVGINSSLQNLARFVQG